MKINSYSELLLATGGQTHVESKTRRILANFGCECSQKLVVLLVLYANPAALPEQLSKKFEI
jgi:hypothetical protein